MLFYHIYEWFKFFFITQKVELKKTILPLAFFAYFTFAENTKL